MSITAEDALAWLESKAPYSTMERDKAYADIAALVRSLEQVRVVTEAFKENPTLRTWVPVREALDAHRKEFGT